MISKNKIESKEEPQVRQNEQAKSKWYKQSAVWAVIISIIALVLSQLPPVAEWIKKESIDADISKRIVVGSTIGMPEYGFQVDLKNTGNRVLAISDLEIEITYPSGKKKNHIAQFYPKPVNGSSESQIIPITRIQLDLRERWSEWVIFHSDLSPQEEEDNDRIRKEFFDTPMSLPVPSGNNKIYEYKEKIIAEATKLFDQRNEIEKGTYKVSLICNANGKRFLLEKFEYTLFEAQINTYKSQVEGYKDGFGLTSPVEPSKQLWVTISNVTNNENVTIP